MAISNRCFYRFQDCGLFLGPIPLTSHFNVSWFRTMAIRQFDFSLLRLVPLLRFNAFSSKVCVGYCVGLDYGHWICLLNADDGFRNESYDAGQMVFDIRWIHHNFNNLKFFGNSFFYNKPENVAIDKLMTSIKNSIFQIFVSCIRHLPNYKGMKTHVQNHKQRFLSIVDDSSRIFTRSSN